jgi:hypothetical protein
VTVAADLADRIHQIDHDVYAEAALPEAVNRIAEAAAGSWVYYCYNAEYLFFPFCETRTVRDLLSFHAEERREAMLTYVIDLYAGDLNRHGQRGLAGRPRTWTGRAITRWPARTRRRTGTPRTASWISSAACAGGSRNTSPGPGARSTASGSSRRARG